ncbi:putative bifunctional diguanylate cyclase/phosphodiesterase [Thauera mechernichensis]|uniref:Bifunctional diguanylate cyclase/phosphodiesterase n=1 Tax=Thauera mechernichensis TaxID=82788 RepID=A0ABW3WAG2_9RHOO|nr:EAL domain-containing protein [Thauera mechernichensis]MDG3063651.1 EAL domain-containing protein [Thauera mechernichensis]
MKAGRSVLLLLLLPLGIVVLVALMVNYGALSSVREQFDLSSAAQDEDLVVIEEAASFSRDMGLIQRQMAVALDGAKSGQLDELQLYRMHTRIVEELAALGERVRRLAESELVIDANHNSARQLIHSFGEYRRFIVMTTDVIAVDPRVAADFLDQAQVEHREFSIFSSRIVSLLAERARDRNAAQVARFDDAFRGVLLTGLIILIGLFVTASLLGRRAGSHMVDIADALSTLARSAEAKIPLPRIEAMYEGGRGEFARIAGTLLNFRNAIERQRSAEAQAFQLAFYDPLTRLPNRRLLSERMRSVLRACEQHLGHAGVIVLDLDDFKRVNDAYGHGVGDRLLVEVAARLESVVGEGNTLAHLGGDEFAILLGPIGADAGSAVGEVEACAERVLAAFAGAFQIDGESLYATASLGASLFGTPLANLDDPLRHAENAMYQAKSEGRGNLRFFDPVIQARLEERIALESELRLAIERDQLELFYQVQVDENDRLQGVEALLRWRHPVRGLVPPAAFIGLAEESGLILPIGHWVLETACAQLLAWAGDARTAQLSIAVNVSARQFRQDDFVQQVGGVLERTGAPPRRLKLELTESTVLEDIESTIVKMKALRAFGVRFSMDDFGTGYSSLQYLKRLPLDQLKIDQAFVRDIIDDADDAVIVQAIIAMSHALGLEVIAEGVETREQQQLLGQQGCRFFQGYLFGKPVPLDELAQRLR